MGRTSTLDHPQIHAARHDARLMGDRMRESWQRWLAAVCHKQPTVLLIDDMHWCDRPSAALLDAMLRNEPDLPLLVVALARPSVHERFDDLWSEHALTQLTLGRLRPRAARQLARAVLGDDCDDTHIEALVERADGNAFFLEELLRAAHDGSPSDTLPDSVLATVESRLRKRSEGRTPPATRRQRVRDMPSNRRAWPSS